MLGNIIGKRFLTPAHHRSNFMMHNPESRLKALRSSDRSVKHLNYARETDKGNQFFNWLDIQSEHIL